ncbi:WRC [Musa troglodytarum]|uniref:WRC n=1 Tax=Musa troglodytarum TaxID=320322 RepID=A0A9E7EM21_9LILI|nr:WRC [Musa troglodytarum]
MRIRKCAARLLGTPPVCSSPPLPAGLASSPSPPPQPRSWESETSSAAATSSSAGLLCELNRSPWDDLLCLDLMASCDLEEEEEEDGGSLGNGVKDEVEESKGIMGNRIKYEAAAAASLPDSSEASMNRLAGKAEGKARKKATVKVKRKKKDKVINTSGGTAAVTKGSASCKKSDGKGWHCKRPAQHPHSLCRYHLSQLRSYSCTHGNGKVAESAKEGPVGVAGRKKKTDIAGADSNFYYYYSGFGPWRRKMRGGSSDNGDQCDHHASDEDDGNEYSESGDGYDAAVAGDDQDSDDEDCFNDGGSEGNKRSCRKRGRRKMKARSLKSLL